MKKFILNVTVAVFVGGFGGVGSLALAVAGETVTVGVKGMVCAFCAQGIEKSLKAEAAVEAVEVSLEKKHVKITYKDGQKLSDEKIATILKESGYEAVFNK